ncbi:MAG: hypothetical protein ACRBBN_13530 [Methyloligellaceae bacterium]
MIPHISQHHDSALEYWFGGLHGAQKRFKLAFNFGFSNGLAIAGAALFLAKVVGVMPVLPLGPRRSQLMATISAQHKPA